MAKVALSKTELQRQRESMRLYKRVLPSLELKRMQLTGELKRSREQLEGAMGEEQRLREETARQLPMVADGELDFSGDG